MGWSSLELADVEKKVAFARLHPEVYFKLQRLMAVETERQQKKITMQEMISLLITRADTPSPTPSETETAAADAPQTSASETDTQLPET